MEKYLIYHFVLISNCLLLDIAFNLKLVSAIDVSSIWGLLIRIVCDNALSVDIDLLSDSLNEGDNLS